MLAHLFENNRNWAERINRTQPGLFGRLLAQQAPRYLWIGCSDSRVPANEIVGLLPGELFVHRNVANQVIHTDINCLSVIQYSVDILKIQEVIVCGHYGCGGVQAALETRPHGLVDNWLRHIRDLAWRSQPELSQLPPAADRLRRMCELNVVEQVVNVANTTVIQDAWLRGQPVTVHGLIYDLADGLLKDLEVSLDSLAQLETLQEAR